MNEKKKCAGSWNGLLPILVLGHDIGDCIVTQGLGGRAGAYSRRDDTAPTRCSLDLVLTQCTVYSHCLDHCSWTLFTSFFKKIKIKIK